MMNQKTTGAKVLTREELRVRERPLPQSLIKAAGLLRHRKKDLERHLEQVRQEWESRWPRP